MNVRKKRNRFFVLKIVLLTILLIGALAGVFIATIFQFINGFDIPGLVAILAGFVLGYWCIKQMKKLNGSWVSRMIEEIRTGDIESSLQWNFEEAEWREFVMWKKKQDKEDVKGTIIWVWIIAAIIFFAMAYSSFSILPLLVVSIVGGFLFAVLISLLVFWGNSVNLRKMKSQSSGKVWFTENAILVNDLLIYFNQMGTTIGKILIDEDEEMGPLVHLTTVVKAGARSTEKTYSFPVPSDSIEDAESLVIFYSS